MRSFPLTLAVAVAGALVLTACGSQRGADGAPRAGGSGSADASGNSSCGARTSDAWAEPTDLALPGYPSGLDKDGVRITGLRKGFPLCFAFDVTNHGTAALTYTIAFDVRSGSGAGLTAAEQTVAAVGPGRSVQRVFVVDPSASEGGGTSAGTAGVRITKVRSVPVDELSPAGGTCPPSGVNVYVDRGDAAMGLRAVGLHLRNCGTRDYALNGYPQLQIVDEEHQPVSGVKVLHGARAITTSSDADGAPRPLVLKPGESASSSLVWRNTVEMGVGGLVNAPYVRVWAKPGAAPVTVVPELDLGTTGKLGVGPWKKDEGRGPTSGRPSVPPSAPTAVPTRT